MNRLWNLVALAVVGFVWGPVDRTVCAWANVTHKEQS
jgi:hypothetical protein